MAAGVRPDLAQPHVQRHTLCSTMAASHGDLYAIQQRAGHKNISNTMIYTHVSDEQASESCREALMKAFLPKLFFPPTRKGLEDRYREVRLRLRAPYHLMGWSAAISGTCRVR